MLRRRFLMNRFSLWLANIMRGRYGVDQFSRFMLVLSIILVVLNMFIRTRLLHLLIVALLIYIYCRIFSRNYSARANENQKFLQIMSRFRGNKSFAKDNTHRILRCPSCGERLRVPKGAGRIKISCPHCGTQFMKKV